MRYRVSDIYLRDAVSVSEGDEEIGKKVFLVSCAEWI